MDAFPACACPVEWLLPPLVVEVEEEDVAAAAPPGVTMVPVFLVIAGAKYRCLSARCGGLSDTREDKQEARDE